MEEPVSLVRDAQVSIEKYEDRPVIPISLEKIHDRSDFRFSLCGARF